MAASRFDRWASAFEHERRVAGDLVRACHAFDMATASGDSRAVRLARRARGRLNAQHVSAMQRERAARARLSRADVELARLWAVREVVA